MSTEEDNFDIDIYGEGGGEEYDEGTRVEENLHLDERTYDSAHGTGEQRASNIGSTDSRGDNISANQRGSKGPVDESNYEGHPATEHVTPFPQGTKRKEAAEDRQTDPGATGALFISDLPWWITDDDIRGWSNESGCEEELEEVTFSEHKVNGKSKGQAYVLFSNPQAATATKHLMDSFGESHKFKQKFTCNYTNPLVNPFKTLPKDGNTRNSSQSNRAAPGGFSSAGGQGQPGMNQGGFRGGRGGYGNRGSTGGYSRGNYQQSVGGNYQGNLNNFQGGIQYGGFQNRGGMMNNMRGGSMGIRGGRGGMNNMMGIPMGGIMGGIGNMPGQMPSMNMNMPGMGMQGTAGYSLHASSHRAPQSKASKSSMHIYATCQAPKMGAD